MSESSQQQRQWWKDKYQYPTTGSYIPHPSPLLSDREEEDQIKSWLCLPSDMNRDNNAMLFGADLNNTQTMEGSDDKMPLMMTCDVDAVPSESVAKGHETASMSKIGTSHAPKVKKMIKQKQRLRSGCQNRRGKINEKIKALQKLIPRCSKLDKASILDKAIGYLKDLQMQIRMMSGGYDIGMQMFPGVPQAPVSMFPDDPALPTSIHANLNPGRVCLGPPMIPYAPALPFPAPPVRVPYQQNVAYSMFQFPQGEDPHAFPFGMLGNFQM